MTAEPVLVRPAERDDIGALVELMREHARYERAQPPRPDLAAALTAALFHPGARLHVLVAADEHELLGYASWALEMSTWQVAEYAHLDCLYLRENARERGVGGELLSAVRAAARSAGVVELQWQTPDWNEGAIRFYRRAGAQGKPKIRFSLGTSL